MPYQRTTRVDGRAVPIPGKWVAQLVTAEGRLKAEAPSRRAAETLERRWRRGDTAGFRPTGPNAPARPLGELIAQAAASIYRDKNDTYRAAQTARMHRFVAWARSASGEDVAPDWPTTQELLRWRDHLQEHGHDGAPLSSSTINAKLAAVRSLLDWCHSRGHRAQAAPVVKQIAVRDAAPGYLRVEEEDQLVAKLREMGQDEAADFVRASCMSGLRLQEMLGLRPGDLGEDQVFLRTQKSGTPGSVHIVPEVRKILMRRVPWRCTPRGLSYWLERAKTRLGWSASDDPRLRDLTLHSTRHTTATRLVEAGVDLRVIKEILRHEDIRHTMRYAKLRPGLLGDKVMALSRTLPEEEG